MPCEHLRADGLVSDADGISRLSHMDFYAAAGEAVGLIGLSGAGKSTLAEVLCGESAAGGRVWLNGTPTTPGKLAQNGALVRRDSQLLGNLTITDNLMALRPPTRWVPQLFSGREQRRRCAALLNQFEMGDFLDRAVVEIPSPVQHRLLMLGALVRGKRFLALDHLSDGCTLQEQAQLADCIQRLCYSGITVLYITGHIDTALRRMDRITVMREGRRAKELRRGAYRERDLYTYVYGYHAETAGHLAGIRKPGDVVLSLDGLSFRANGFIAVHDADGSAPALIARLRLETKEPISALSADDLSNCWISSMSVLDNLMLTVAPRMCGVSCHVRRSVYRVLRQECAAQAALKPEQVDAPFARLTRLERFRVLLYRERLRRPGIRIFDRITAGADFQDRESMAQLIGTLPETVFYLSSDRAELEWFGTGILSLAAGRLQKEEP